MLLAFVSLFLIVHSYVAWAAGRVAAPLPRVGRFGVGLLVVLTPLLLLAAHEVLTFDGRCLEMPVEPCDLGEHLSALIPVKWLPSLAFPMLIWIGFYSASLSRANFEA